MNYIALHTALIYFSHIVTNIILLPQLNRHILMYLVL